MSNQFNKITAFLKIATDILFVRNPVGTSMGILFGVLLQGTANVIAPIIELAWSIKLSVLRIYHYIAFGAFTFNIKQLGEKKRNIPDIEDALLLIDKLERQGKISIGQATLAYRDVVNRVIENVKLNHNSEVQAELFKKILEREIIS